MGFNRSNYNAGFRPTRQKVDTQNEQLQMSRVQMVEENYKYIFIANRLLYKVYRQGRQRLNYLIQQGFTVKRRTVVVHFKILLLLPHLLNSTQSDIRLNLMSCILLRYQFRIYRVSRKHMIKKELQYYLDQEKTICSKFLTLICFANRETMVRWILMKFILYILINQLSSFAFSK